MRDSFKSRTTLAVGQQSYEIHSLPALQGHDKPLVAQYGTVFLLAFLFIKLFEYNGGMLNQAQRYMATSGPKDAERSARLSAVLWLVWPLVLFFPMWMSPLLVTSNTKSVSS